MQSKTTGGSPQTEADTAKADSKPDLLSDTDSPIGEKDTLVSHPLPDEVSSSAGKGNEASSGIDWIYFFLNSSFCILHS